MSGRAVVEVVLESDVDLTAKVVKELSESGLGLTVVVVEVLGQGTHDPLIIPQKCIDLDQQLLMVIVQDHVNLVLQFHVILLKHRVRLLVAGGLSLHRYHRLVDPIVMFREAVVQVTDQLAIITKEGVDLVLELRVAVPQLSQRVLILGRGPIEILHDQHVHLIVVMPERLVEAVGVSLVVACHLLDLVFQCLISRLERGVRPLLGE